MTFFALQKFLRTMLFGIPQEFPEAASQYLLSSNPRGGPIMLFDRNVGEPNCRTSGPHP
jgi:hypothetical protein